MTYDELIRAVAERTSTVTKTEVVQIRSRGGIALSKVEEIVRETFNQIHSKVLGEGKEVAIPTFGRFVTKAKRSSGVKPDGQRWNKPGRAVLALKASPTKSTKQKPANVTAPFASTGS